MSDQFLRKASLILINGTAGLDLSEMRFRFEIAQSDIETPNTALIRVFNLSDATARRVQGEFSQVVINAGYQQGAYGVIFNGNIKEVRRGRLMENNVDTYVDIFAADGDLAYNFATVNKTLAAGATAQDTFNTLSAALGGAGYTMDMPPSALARGKVMFGVARDYMRDLATTMGASWSIQNGKVVIVPLNGYRPGEAVKINSATGMIGFPIQTPGGIEIASLLNPRIAIGTLIQLNDADIQRLLISQNVPGVALYESGKVTDWAPFLPEVPRGDGFYKVLVHEFVGDTRGQEWYSRLVALAVDPSAAASAQVKPYYAGPPSSPVMN